MSNENLILTVLPGRITVNSIISKGVGTKWTSIYKKRWISEICDVTVAFIND